MRFSVLLKTRAYPLAISLWIMPIDIWTLRGVTNPLQDGGLAGVRSSDNEDSELDISGDSGKNSMVSRRLGRGLTHPLDKMCCEKESCNRTDSEHAWIACWVSTNTCPLTTYT